MLEVVLISLVAPIVVGVALLVMRQRQPRLTTDTRGIALQTVIIIVVLLAIAASVAGVLFSRAADVTTELENVDVTAQNTHVVSRTECTTASKEPGGSSANWDTGIATRGQCLWKTSADMTTALNTARRGDCNSINGSYTDGATTGTAGTDARKGKCRILNTGIV